MKTYNTEYALEVYNDKGFVKQIDMFKDSAHAKQFVKSGNTELNDGEYFKINCIVHDMTKYIGYDKEEIENEYSYWIKPAHSLPKGWYWTIYNDGSGSLISPKDEWYFTYDKQTAPEGIEYKESSKDPYDRFYGNFDEYKKYAEDIVKSKYIIKELAYDLNAVMKELDLYEYNDQYNTEELAVHYFEKCLKEEPETVISDLKEHLEYLEDSQENLKKQIQTMISKIEESCDITPEHQEARLFIDMDGVLAYFNNQIESEEVLYQKGYFRNLLPQSMVVDAVNQLIDKHPDQCYILSAVVESPYAEKEKREWLNTYITSNLKEDHIIFTKCGEKKNDYIPGKIRSNDILLDDYTKNLKEFKAAGGIGVKLVNDINNKNHTWKGLRVHYQETPENLVNKLENVMTEELSQKTIREMNEQTTIAVPIRFF